MPFRWRNAPLELRTAVLGRKGTVLELRTAFLGRKGAFLGRKDAVLRPWGLLKGSAPSPFVRAVTPFARALNGALEEAPAASQPRPAAPAIDDLLAALADEAVAAASPAWATGLGLALPCGEEDVKRAFRRLARTTHPDCEGGSHEAFLRAQQLRDEALAAVRKVERFASPVRFARSAPDARSSVSVCV